MDHVGKKLYYMKEVFVMGENKDNGPVCDFEKRVPSPADLGIVICPKCGSFIADERCDCGVSKKAVNELKLIPLDLLRGKQKGKVIELDRRRKGKRSRRENLFAFPVIGKEVIFVRSSTTCSCGGTANKKGRCNECGKDLIMG